MLERFNTIKEHHQKRKNTYAAQQGKLETYYENLKLLGHDTVDQGKVDLQDASDTLKRLGILIEKKLAEYEEEFDL